jgi:thioredoxin reductase
MQALHKDAFRWLTARKRSGIHPKHDGNLGETARLLTIRDTGHDLEHSPGHRPPLPLETSLQGVFCAGDVRHGSIKRVASGVGEGSMAITFIHQHLATR